MECHAPTNYAPRSPLAFEKDKRAFERPGPENTVEKKSPDLQGSTIKRAPFGFSNMF